MHSSYPLKHIELYYLNCQFDDVLEVCEDPSVRCEELACLHVRTLCEMDESEQAAEMADFYRDIFPNSGGIPYHQGNAYYQAGRSKPEIEQCYDLAYKRGHEGGRLGKGFIAFLEGNHEEAVRFFKDGRMKEPELEHRRHLMLFQVYLDLGYLDQAGSHLDMSYKFLNTFPSLLRKHWSDLCLVRYLRAKKEFGKADEIVTRLIQAVEYSGVRRIYRNAREAKRFIQERTANTDIYYPEDNPIIARAHERAITRKPMLNSLFKYLCEKGGRGASKEELSEKVWEESYNPMIHDIRLYKAIERLRTLLGDSGDMPHIIVQEGKRYVLRVN